MEARGLGFAESRPHVRWVRFNDLPICLSRLTIAAEPVQRGPEVEAGCDEVGVEGERNSVLLDRPVIGSDSSLDHAEVMANLGLVRGNEIQIEGFPVVSACRLVLSQPEVRHGETSARTIPVETERTEPLEIRNRLPVVVKSQVRA